MWRVLPQQGSSLTRVEIHRANELVIVPASGERLRLAVRGTAGIETVGNVLVRSETQGDRTRVTFTGDTLVLEHAHVTFEGDDREWADVWRRARTQSRPWWNADEGDEIDLGWVGDVSLRIAGTWGGRRSSWLPPAPDASR